MFTIAIGPMLGLAVGQLSPLTHQMTWTQGLDNPARLAEADGTWLIADTRADRVVRYDSSGAYLGEWAEPAGPVGIAAHPDGRIFVSRRDDRRVAVHDAQYAFLGFLGIGAVSFVEPTDLAIDPLTGRIYVVDTGADRVYAFHSSGTLAVMFGSCGSGFGQFKYPTAVAVDPFTSRVLVADQDNFRVQVFDTAGMFLFSFGYRIKYLPSGTSAGWFTRTAGLATDGAGRIYVTDALMGTLRIFSPSGLELGEVVGFGANPGELQNPGEVALDGSGRVYVANANVGTVEVYDAPSPSMLAAVSPEWFSGTNETVSDRLTSPVRRTLPWYDKLRRGTQRLTEEGVTATSSWDAPHMLSDLSCGRCHNVPDQPLGHLGTLDGQTNLCLSCHNGAGQALEASLRTADRVLISLNTDSGGRSHAWGVSAINSAVGSVGPPAGSEMARYLSSGKIKCATCHDQHSQIAGRPYLRTKNDSGGLCKQCHAEHVGHTPRGSWQPTCNECHDAHNPNSDNLGLIRTDVRNRTLGLDKAVTLVARTGPGSFDDGDPAANDGLCQVCHLTTAYHRHDGSGAPHNNGQDCISCHPHDNGFLPVSGGDCTSCHAVAQDNGDGVPVGGRRAVVGEFPATDAHAHYGATLGGDACVVCHDMTTHQDGYVDLLDADDGSLYRFQKPGDLAGDPDVSNFCMSCHDPDGASRFTTPLDPFNNGNSPPAVAAKFLGTLQWDEQYGDFCFGTEGTLRGVNSHHDVRDADQAFSGAKIECLDCHGAHSAGASQPLVDPFHATQPWTGSNNAFCLSCHNGGTGPLDPGFPAGVFGPAIDTTDPRWASLGINWTTTLGGACVGGGCSSLRGIDSCDYVDGPWYVDYSWTHSAHGPDSKRGWNGYSGAPGADMDCTTCHDPHGSTTATNPAGNPYMIRDAIDGTAFVDDGTRSGGFNGPPWNAYGTGRPVVVPVSGTTVGWGAGSGLCGACHANWIQAYDWHEFCNGCQTCHGHGMAWGEADWVGFDNDTPCPIPNAASLGEFSVPAAMPGEPESPTRMEPQLHRIDRRRE